MTSSNLKNETVYSTLYDISLIFLSVILHYEIQFKIFFNIHITENSVRYETEKYDSLTSSSVLKDYHCIV